MKKECLAVASIKLTVIWIHHAWYNEQ